MCSCFSNRADEGLIPPDEHAPRLAQAKPPQLQSKMPKRKSTIKPMAESNVPSWQRTSHSSGNLSSPPITGRRSRGASASNGSLPSTGTTAHNRRFDDPTGNMLYFGTGLSPEQAMKAYTSPTPVNSSSTPAAKRHTAVAGNASTGRDASGYLSSSVGSTNGMNGTYSSLTYGGSLQYNFAGTQSYGAGTAGGSGNGLM